MTPTQFKRARKSLGLSREELAAVLNASVASIIKWETVSGINARKPNPVACRAMEWLLAGYIPNVKGTDQ